MLHLWKEDAALLGSLLLFLEAPFTIGEGRALFHRYEGSDDGPALQAIGGIFAEKGGIRRKNAENGRRWVVGGGWGGSVRRFFAE